MKRTESQPSACAALSSRANVPAPSEKLSGSMNPQMLQWLVYRQSEAWERLTERGEGFYLPSEEDLIVRYLEHLVFISLRRGSFYVTLAVGASAPPIRSS